MSSHTVETQTQTQTQPQLRQAQPRSYHRVANPVMETEYRSAEHLYAQQHYQQHHSAQYAGVAQRQVPQPHSHAAGANATQNGKVLAERYKTKVCKNFLEMGMCPYETRCMFAHGEDELRTAEMNLHDGIVTEEAIRHFKRMQQYKQQAQQAALDATQGYSSYQSGNHSPVGSLSQGPPSYELSSFASTHMAGSGHFTEESPMGSRKNSSHCMSFNTGGDQYAYDPYGWTPYHNDANPNCECADCLYNQEVEFSAKQPTTTEQSEESTPESPIDGVEAARQRHGINDVSPVPQKASANSTAQADVAGHSLRRPIMP